jgi:hypothetical protein
MNKIDRELAKKEKLLKEKQEQAFINRVLSVFNPSIFGLENSIKAVKNYLSERLTNLGEGMQENKKEINERLDKIEIKLNEIEKKL